VAYRDLLLNHDRPYNNNNNHGNNNNNNNRPYNNNNNNGNNNNCNRPNQNSENINANYASVPFDYTSNCISEHVPQVNVITPNQQSGPNRTGCSIITRSGKVTLNTTPPRLSPSPSNFRQYNVIDQL